MYFEKRTENCDEEESWTGKKEEVIMVSYSLTLSDAEKSYQEASLRLLPAIKALIVRKEESPVNYGKQQPDLMYCAESPRV